MESQESQIEKRLREMPRTYRNFYKKAMQGRSLKTAIRAFCLECVQWQRAEVENCTDTGCPLYPYRPYQEVPWKASRHSKERSEKQVDSAKRLVELKKKHQGILCAPIVF